MRESECAVSHEAHVLSRSPQTVQSGKSGDKRDGEKRDRENPARECLTHDYHHHHQHHQQNISKGRLLPTMNSRKKNQAEVSSTSAENSVEWLTTRVAIVEVLTGRLQQLLAGLLSDLSPTIRLFLDGALLVTADVASGRSEDQLRTLVGRLFGGGSRIVLPSPARAQTLRPLPLRRLLPPPPPPTLQPLAQRLETLIEEWSSRKRSAEEQQAKSLEEARKKKEEERKKKEEERKKKEEERKKKEEQDFLDLWKGPGVHILRVEANGLFICELQVQLMPRLTVSEMTRFSPL